jgi:hypothetical protein
MPKADLVFSFRTPVMIASAEAAIYTTIFLDMVQEQANEFAYYADLADLGFDLSPSSTGFSVCYSFDVLLSGFIFACSVEFILVSLTIFRTSLRYLDSTTGKAC